MIEANDTEREDQAVRDHGTNPAPHRSYSTCRTYCYTDAQWTSVTADRFSSSGIGDEGQRRLLAARVLIVGCGALGSAHAESLARAGVGHLRIVDRDFVEPSNLQRQTMFTESDAEQRLPKAIAAASHLRQINSQIEIEPHILDINYSSVERLLDGCDLVIDGTDY